MNKRDSETAIQLVYCQMFFYHKSAYEYRWKNLNQNKKNGGNI